MQAYISSLQKDLAAKKVAQQQQQAPRTANAAAAPKPLRVSYAGVVAPWKVQQQLQQQQQQPQWNCTSCGRGHAAWHTECYPCAKLLAGLSPKGSTPPVQKPMEVEEVCDETCLDGALEDVTKLEQVHGPDISVLIKHLLVLPSEEGAPPTAICALAQKIRAAEAELTDANEDASAAMLGSSRLQKAADEHVKVCEAAVAALKSTATPATTPDTLLSPSEADRRRANLGVGHEAWLTRAAKRKEAILAEASTALQAIEDAEVALRTQRDHIVEQQSLHARAWEAHNSVVCANHLGRTEQLEAVCRLVKPVLAVQVAEDSSELQQMKKQMESMQSQIALQASTHAQMLVENNSRFESALEKWKVHCAELKSQLKEGVKLATLSPSETELRKAHADSAKGAALTAVADTAPSGAVKAAQVVDGAGANY